MTYRRPQPPPGSHKPHPVDEYMKWLEAHPEVKVVHCFESDRHGAEPRIHNLRARWQVEYVPNEDYE